MVSMMNKEMNMRTYKAFYNGKSIVVTAETSFAAQLMAAKLFKAKKSYNVAVILADTPLNTASI
jgi:hypothetical protein